MYHIPAETFREIASRCDPVGALALSHSCMRFRDELSYMGLNSASIFYMLKIAVGNGHIRVVEWLYSLGYTAKAIERERYMIPQLYSGEYDNCNILDVAAAGAHLRVFKWLLSHGFSCGWNTPKAVSYGGNMKIMNILKMEMRGYIFATDEFGIICATGNLKLLKWMLKQPNNTYGRNCIPLSPAIAMGHLHVVKWLMRWRKPITVFRASQYMTCAAYNGHFDIVRFFAEKIDNQPSNIATIEELDIWMVAHTGARYTPCILTQYDRADAQCFILNKLRARYGKK